MCASNQEAVLELDADGTLTEMTPIGGNTCARNTALLFQLHAWARSVGDWLVFDSSGGFLLADDRSAAKMPAWCAWSAGGP